jgi:flagellar motor switch protein FliN/FliY
VVAQLTWPRLSTRVGLGIEPPLAHALVDRLLGFDRLPAEGRLQVTPVEWGILSFVMARALDRLDEAPGPLGPWDLAIDRVGPDLFDPAGLGPIVTWRWRVRLGQTAASARLWLPESLLALWLLDEPPTPKAPFSITRFADLTSVWKAEAGAISLPKGLSRLRPGSLQLMEGSPLSGTPRSPEGPIQLAQDDPTARSYFRARALPESNAARLILESPLTRDPRPRETPAMPGPTDSTETPSEAVKPADVPVTLTVELGRVNLPLHRLADLKPGDVLELGRHAREPVELTSGGRLIARGELVQVDTELGVRVTQVFL